MSVLQNLQKCRNLHDYLRTIPHNVVDELFEHSAPCLAIFRELPKLAQHYVLRTLYVEQVVPQAVVQTWVSKAHTKEHSEAVEALNSLWIWNDHPLAGGLPGWILNPKFRHNLKVALLGGGKAWTQSQNLDIDPKARTIKDLDAYALGRWEALLHFLAEKPQKDDSVSRDTILTLTHAGLMEREGDKPPSITNEGFQFLLLDTASQVWYFLVKYLETVEDRGMKLSECLAFLFSLSFGTLGKDYSTEGFNEPMQQFMQHLREFGLLYQRTRKAGRFYPTKLALNLVSGNRLVTLDTEKHKTGFVVVETNYRLYAYSDSDLQLALVGMFTDFLFRFPNLVVGVITRDSIRQALRTGITAEQIITFLHMHAHQTMKASGSSSHSVPPSVVDQIRLWEMERNRLTYSESVLYNQFLSQRDYEVVRDYAQGIGVLAHSSDQKRTIVVSKNGHDDVKRFWKKHSKGNN
jgi:transcription initiation factor TFIIH subunit 4